MVVADFGGFLAGPVRRIVLGAGSVADDPGALSHGVRAQGAAIIRELFKPPDGPGVRALIDHQHRGMRPQLSDQPASAR